MAGSTSSHRYRELPLSRPAPYVGKLAGSEWGFTSCTEGDGGWKTLEMVQRYAHLSAGHLTDHAHKLDSILGVHGTKMAQGENVVYLKAK